MKPDPAMLAGRAALDDYAWLTSPEAEPTLREAATSRDSLVTQIARLRKRLPPARAQLIVEQVELRRRAAAKFPQAERMFFTSRGLEQASDAIVAAYKAGRFGRGPVYDLCCGIGGDLIALAERGAAVGVDRDDAIAHLAAANLRVCLDGQSDHQSSSRTLVADINSLDLAAAEAWHIDPDRRPQGRRTTQLELHEPGPETIERLLAANPQGAIKLAPACEVSAAWSEQAELEWISRGRECRQLVAWFGRLASVPGQRRATILSTSACQVRSIVGHPHEPVPVAAEIGRYLLEPDAAVLASGLSGALAAEHGLSAIAPGAAYWTADRAVDDPALSCFEVLDVMPFRAKPLKSWLRERGVGQLEIKKRGVDVDPAELRRQLSLQGPHSATLLVARIERRVLAILARRVGQKVGQASA